MEKLTMFYLENCPYCRNARRALDALRAEKPEYEAVCIDMVEESREPAKAEKYDYYYVPTIFMGGRKLYEATPGESYEACMAQVRAALDAALGA